MLAPAEAHLQAQASEKHRHVAKKTSFVVCAELTCLPEAPYVQTTCRCRCAMHIQVSEQHRSTDDPGIEVAKETPQARAVVGRQTACGLCATFLQKLCDCTRRNEDGPLIIQRAGQSHLSKDPAARLLT